MTTMNDCDIQFSMGGHRAVWRATSARGREWADAHSSLTDLAPEGVECLARHCDPLIRRALMAGLHVKDGEVEVSLC